LGVFSLSKGFFPMKKFRKLFAISLFALICALLYAVGASAQIIGSEGHLQQTAGMPWQLGGDWKFNSASTATPGFDVRGLSYYRLTWVPVGTVSACTLSLDSATSVVAGTGALSSPSIGGILSAGTIGSCATAGSYVTSTTAGISAYGQITPTITGTGSVIVVLYGYTDSKAAGAGSSVTVTSPVDGSNYVEVNCKTGCSAGNANGQATMANSSPFVMASDQSAIPVTGTFYQATQPVSIATAPTTPTQPSGFSSSPLSGQVAATASAVALASNSTHIVCITALTANTIPVYVGATGITTSTGFPLNAGDFYCWQVNNSNLLYLIASTTGASVAWTAQ
jgi:hypothetical protein